jgi:hypothetical protein
LICRSELAADVREHARTCALNSGQDSWRQAIASPRGLAHWGKPMRSRSAPPVLGKSVCNVEKHDYGRERRPLDNVELFVRG